MAIPRQFGWTLAALAVLSRRACEYRTEPTVAVRERTGHAIRDVLVWTFNSAMAAARP